MTELSLDVADYVDEITQENELSQTPAPQFQDVLIFGNHFLHKFVRPTAEHLAQKLTNHRIFMFGDTGPTRFPNIISSASGKLGAAEMNALYRNAACVVYPSTYEGFGLPVVEALARNQTVYVRDTPLNRWIRNRWNGPGKLIFFTTLSELAEHIQRTMPAAKRPNQSVQPLRQSQPNGQSWNDMGRKILILLSEMAGDTSNTQFWRRLDQQYYLRTYAAHQDQYQKRHTPARLRQRSKPTFMHSIRQYPMKIVKEIRRFYHRRLK